LFAFPRTKFASQSSEFGSGSLGLRLLRLRAAVEDAERVASFLHFQALIVTLPAEHELASMISIT
jgi:hypothetical protein